MSSEANSRFIYELVAIFPVLRALLHEHLEEMDGELLPYVFLGSLMALIVENHDADYVDPIFDYVEKAFKAGGDERENLIAVGFWEVLPRPWEEPKGFWGRLGPVAYTQANASLGRERDGPVSMGFEEADAFAHTRDEKSKGELSLMNLLRKAGDNVDSAWDLDWNHRTYPELLPVLVEHLQYDYPDSVREGIGRALAVGPEGMPIWDELIELYRRERGDTGARAGMAAALSGIAGEDEVGDLIELVRNPCCGASRSLLLWRIYKSKHPGARQVIEGLTDDPVLREGARFLLGMDP